MCPRSSKSRRCTKIWSVWARRTWVKSQEELLGTQEVIKRWQNHTTGISWMTSLDGNDKHLNNYLLLLCSKHRRTGHPQPSQEPQSIGQDQCFPITLDRLERGKRHYVKAVVHETGHPPRQTWLPRS